MPLQRSRRHFLATSATLPIALQSFASPILQPRWLLLGTDQGKGIYRAPWNAITGEIGASELILTATRPAFFARHPTLPVLYSANEANTGDGNVSALRIDHAAGTVKQINNVTAASPGSCYISIDHKGRNVFIANYGGGSLTTIPVATDGSLAQSNTIYDCKTHGCGPTGPNTAPAPNNTRQDAPHFHCANVSPDNNFVLVCDLGTDSIEIFPINASIPSATPKRIPTRPGSGPRHVAFHPNGRWLYVIHELDCTLELFDWDPHHEPQLTPRKGSVISTLASRDHLPGSTACELVISRDGRFLYANTRGEDSLTVYLIDQTTGLLTERQRVATQGKVTRLIAFDPSLRWLLCLNQGSSTISVFAYNPRTGLLSDSPKLYPANSPMCVEWL